MRERWSALATDAHGPARHRIHVPQRGDALRLRLPGEPPGSRHWRDAAPLRQWHAPVPPTPARSYPGEGSACDARAGLKLSQRKHCP